MNSPHSSSLHPADLAPLSYGTGLALGLMLILGLPGETKRPASGLRTGNPHGFVRRAMDGAAARERHIGVAASRP